MRHHLTPTLNYYRSPCSKCPCLLLQAGHCLLISIGDRVRNIPKGRICRSPIHVDASGVQQAGEYLVYWRGGQRSFAYLTALPVSHPEAIDFADRLKEQTFRNFYRISGDAVSMNF